MFGLSYWILPLFAAGTWFGALVMLHARDDEEDRLEAHED